MYERAWDTRCRNVDVARVLRRFVNGDSTILDAGCGEYGLAQFVNGATVVGVDVIPADHVDADVLFVYGSIVRLPFASDSFSIAASVDVLEHLPEEVRPEAVRELVRVAKNAIVITFPRAGAGREADESFNKRLADSGQPAPAWLTEHLANPYPESAAVIAEIEAEASRAGREVKTSVLYSENLSVARFLRQMASTSRYFYLLGNLIMGLLMPIVPRPKETNAYRAVIIAQF